MHDLRAFRLSAPRERAQAGAEGQFRSAFALGTETAAVRVENQRFMPGARRRTRLGALAAFSVRASP